MDVKHISGRNSAAIVAYYLRCTETGYLIATDVLTKIGPTDEIASKALAQVMDYEEKVAAKKMKPKIAADRYDILNTRVFKALGGGVDAQEIVRRVHTISQTMLYDRTDSRTGNMFRVSLPNDTSKSQTLKIVKDLRDSFPANVPAVFTIHYGKRKDSDGRDINNLHLQGWFSEKPWEGDKWGAPLKQFKTIEGMKSFRAQVDQIIEDAGAAWKKDPLAPKVTIFHPAKSKFMKAMPHDELLKGDFLKEVYNPVLRECLTQEVNKARYFESKRMAEDCATAERSYKREVKIEMSNLELSLHLGGRHVTARVFEFGEQGPNHTGDPADGSDHTCPVRRESGDLDGDATPSLGSVFKARKI